MDQNPFSLLVNLPEEQVSSPFEQTYKCYSASFSEKPEIENGDRIIMPGSALKQLGQSCFEVLPIPWSEIVISGSSHIDYPMMFELRNGDTERVSHCGVLEFSAEEGTVYMPYWMMENLLLQEGDIVQLKNVALPKGTYVRLQPHSKDFLDIPNPKAILEKMLRNFSCLTTGDTVMVVDNNKKYYMDIIETKPSDAVCIIETDCEVEFAPSLNYKEPQEPVPDVISSNSEAEAFREGEAQHTSIKVVEEAIAEGESSFEARVQSFLAKLAKDEVAFEDHNFGAPSEDVVETNGGFRLPRALAEILDKLVAKHGDFLSGVQRNKFSSRALSTFCAAAWSMARVKLEDVSGELLLQWRDAFVDAECFSFQIQFAKDALKRVALAYFGLSARVEVIPEVEKIEAHLTALRAAIEALEKKRMSLLNPGFSGIRGECALATTSLEGQYVGNTLF